MCFREKPIGSFRSGTGLYHIGYRPPFMIIQGSLTPDDYAEATRLMVRPFAARVAAWGSPVMVVPFFPVPYFVQICWGVLAGIYLMFVVLLINTFFWRRSLSQPRNFARQTELHGPRQVEMSAERLRIEGPRRMQDLAWADFVRYKIGRTVILLILRDGRYQILPKRWFTPEQLMEFLRFLGPRR